MTVRLYGILGATALVGGAACAPSARSGDGLRASAAAQRPRLSRLVPDSVRIVIGNVSEIELQGSHLDPLANTVMVGTAAMTQIKSTANGTRITIAIPEQMPSAGEAPPARWVGGRYPVFVRTAAGTSDTLTLVISTTGSMP